jgi:hypothetical protein
MNAYTHVAATLQRATGVVSGPLKAMTDKWGTPHTILRSRQMRGRDTE